MVRNCFVSHCLNLVLALFWFFVCRHLKIANKSARARCLYKYMCTSQTNGPDWYTILYYILGRHLADDYTHKSEIDQRQQRRAKRAIKIECESKSGELHCGSSGCSGVSYGDQVLDSRTGILSVSTFPGFSGSGRWLASPHAKVNGRQSSGHLGAFCPLPIIRRVRTNKIKGEKN